jgi:predicted transcriptional regulator
MEETAYLKNEIIRLNQTIANLNELIGILKRENAALKNRMGINNSNDTNADFRNGAKSSVDTNADFENGLNNSIDAISEIGKGINSSLNTIAENDNGTKNSIDTISEISNGIKSNSDKNSPKTIPFIEITQDHRWYLANELSDFLPSSTQRKALFAIAGELLLINNNGSASYQELRQIANLSAPGFAKHAPKLKRRGLIYRESHKKYKLTQKSKDLIEKTFREQKVIS